MTWKLSDYEPEELNQKEILKQVAREIYYKGGCTLLCKTFIETIGYEYLITSNRVVFADEKHIIKFAASEEGIVYNREEENATYRFKDTEIDVIAPVLDTPKRGYRWIKMQKADRETTDKHYESVKSKLDQINQEADLVDEKIGIINNN